ncbi:MAG TPA: response regulator [Acetobacteraceae bacterium]|nr:response regulator [Acetobacteraceae bacterium]
MADPEESAATPGGGRSLLLIEDDPNVGETLAELLGLEGFCVRLAHDAEIGLSLARRQAPDLVLCDLKLRGRMDGLAFARACRADPSLNRLRIVAVSGYCRPEDRARALAAGFDGLVGKPVELAEIHAVLSAPRGAAA